MLKKSCDWYQNSVA